MTQGTVLLGPPEVHRKIKTKKYLLGTSWVTVRLLLPLHLRITALLEGGGSLAIFQSFRKKMEGFPPGSTCKGVLIPWPTRLLGVPTHMAVAPRVFNEGSS